MWRVIASIVYVYAPARRLLTDLSSGPAPAQKSLPTPDLHQPWLYNFVIEHA